MKHHHPIYSTEMLESYMKRYGVGVSPLVWGKSDGEVLFFAEYHTTHSEQALKAFLDFTIKHYDVTGIGFEGFCSPSGRDFYDEQCKLWDPLPEASFEHVRFVTKKNRMASHHDFLYDKYKDLVYGIEREDILRPALFYYLYEGILNSFVAAIMMTFSQKNAGGTKYDFLSSDYTKFREFVADLKKWCPGQTTFGLEEDIFSLAYSVLLHGTEGDPKEYLTFDESKALGIGWFRKEFEAFYKNICEQEPGHVPPHNLEALSEYIKSTYDTYEQLSELRSSWVLDKRNQAMSEVIQQRATGRDVIIVGRAHVLSKDPSTPNLRPIRKGLELQNLLPYSYRIAMLGVE